MIMLYNILEMTKLQEQRTDLWLPGVKDGLVVGVAWGEVCVALKGQHEKSSW